MAAAEGSDRDGAAGGAGGASDFARATESFIAGAGRGATWKGTGVASRLFVSAVAPPRSARRHWPATGCQPAASCREAVKRAPTRASFQTISSAATDHRESGFEASAARPSSRVLWRR